MQNPWDKAVREMEPRIYVGWRTAISEAESAVKKAERLKEKQGQFRMVPVRHM